MCTSSKAPPAPQPAPEPPAPPAVLEQEAPKTIQKANEDVTAKKKGTKKYRTSALTTNSDSPTTGVTIPT